MPQHCQIKIARILNTFRRWCFKTKVSLYILKVRPLVCFYLNSYIFIIHITIYFIQFDEKNIDIVKKYDKIFRHKETNKLNVTRKIATILKLNRKKRIKNQFNCGKTILLWIISTLLDMNKTRDKIVVRLIDKRHGFTFKVHFTKNNLCSVFKSEQY